MKSNRQWIESVLNHLDTGFVPYNFSFTPPVEKALLEHFQTNDLADALQLPIRMNSPKSVKPLYADPAIFGESAKDEFGVVWSTNKIDRGSPIEPSLKSPELKGYKFPDPNCSERFEHLGQWCQANQGHFRIIWVGDLWERATFMRGLEGMLFDITLNPGFVEKLLDHLSEYILATMKILFHQFEFEAVAISDDYGSQKGLLISPEHWRQFIKPALKKIYSFAKANNKKIFHHSCGHIVPIIGDMIDLGLDILHPIQPETMDIYELKKSFGQNITFCGGMPTQKILPDGSVEEVRNTVRDIITKMSKGAGYIFEPAITVQADIPLDNVLAMIEQAKTHAF